METIETPRAMQAWALAQRRAGRRIGLVPTMGALHDGHISLIRRATERADCVVVSLFVNPTQFGPGEDLARYPRTFEQDSTRCEAEGVACLFAPPTEAVYADDHTVYIVEESLSRGLCGASRPGHFRGVLTVVAKLFNLVLPDVAVFGRKDVQQVALIQRMVRDLNFPVAIEVAPIVREADGLAMSSRNAYLSVSERLSALGLSQALAETAARFAAGETDAAEARESILRRLSGTPGVKVDYVEVLDSITLEPVSQLTCGTLIALAACVGTIRLIDNLVL